MLAVLFCLAGVFALLVISELLGQRKKLRGDLQRQFVHITVGCFIAFWPWLISWRSIQIIGLVMLVVVLLNRRVKLADFYTKVNRQSYGDVFYAVAIILSASLTDEKAFFALAILIMALGDGLANVVGHRYGKNWQYHFLGHIKTVLGSMTMWLVSLSVLGVGLLFDQGVVDYSAYATVLIALPPLLVLIENAAIWGLDNLLVPAVVIAFLNLFK
jgi:dolichol kinase